MLHCPRYTQTMSQKYRITGAAPNGTVLSSVIAATDGPMAQTREHILLSKYKLEFHTS